jgi:replicative DNA helicase
MGKTSFFCQLADYASHSVPVVLFSLEMSKKDVVKMLIYQNSKVDSMKEQVGKLSNQDINDIDTVSIKLKNNKLFIDDRSKNITQMRTALKKAQKQFDNHNLGEIGLIVIDYVQLMHGDKKLQRNYQLEEISRGIKDIAKDFNACVLVLSQLSREVESRADKRPLPSDLKDSGTFEQDCDGLMLMYRDAYYNDRNYSNTSEYEYNSQPLVADIVDINFFLNRHGASDIIHLDMIPQYRLFIDKNNQNLFKQLSGGSSIPRL